MQEASQLPVLFKRLFVLAALLLLVALLALQYRLWFAEGSLRHTAELQQQLAEQEQDNAKLDQRNGRLRAEITALKSGNRQIEARAREDLGLVKPDETFFRFVDEPLVLDNSAPGAVEGE